jgi:hypothetical protein
MIKEKEKELELTHFCDKEKNIILEIKHNHDYNSNSTNKKRIKENYNYIKERFLTNIYVCINKKYDVIKSIKYLIIKFKNFVISKQILTELLNKSLSISIHIWIMIIFEIYFFFEYVVDIENKTFIEKIGDTFKKLENPQLNAIEIEVLKQIIDNEDYILNDLYIQYINSKREQKLILHNLFIKSCKMTIPFGIICLVLTIISLFNLRYIKWKSIFLENIIMFLILGIFEYFFFLNIILKYEPVTNEEIKYFMINNTMSYLSMIENTKR